MSNYPFAPRETFEEILKFMPIPTFDLILYIPNKSVVVVKRTIEPYKNVWALPGLRMYKTESINDTLKRIVKQEVGITIDPNTKQFVGQYVGKFKTEHNRQDISTCYAIKLSENQQVKMNTEHFSNYKFVTNTPKPIGAMYKYYLDLFFKNVEKYK